eukprot:CAMPEP_0202386484 /NCGR_PEP_ID=MMETSP1127-20130417/66685_1 /ASSEMBLY_ACC=CAM_ASM_000462 /TAXON_ID=3047 /ORGANISM="Dunaliella tertiolecta, Strain CCMP1320" /LENGTH=62 /DNA_ID=CAMNT_0048987053 /DNA_START=458 /DNA_END=643 /DNA_ORIENTATION=-
MPSAVSSCAACTPLSVTAATFPPATDGVPSPVCCFAQSRAERGTRPEAEDAAAADTGPDPSS